MTTIAIGYARHSPGDGDELGDQRERIEAAAKVAGMRLACTITDEPCRVRGRPRTTIGGIAAIMDSLEGEDNRAISAAAHWRVLIVTARAKLAHPEADIRPEDIEAFGRRVVEAKDLGAPRGFADPRARGRATRARRRQAAAGMWAQGPAPYGYRLRRSQAGAALEVDDEAAAVVRTAFELYARLGSFGRVAAALGARGQRSAAGSAWSRGQVRRLLRRRCYAGLGAPRIVAPIIWARAQATMRRRSSALAS